MARGPVGNYKCLKCSKDVSLIAKTRHDRSCDGVARTYKAAHNKATDCVFCGRVFRSAIGCGAHMRMCDKNPDCIKKSRPEGWVNWNKGKRSKPDTRNPEYIGKNGGYRPNAGRSQKYKVLDSYGKEVTLQSSYELRCSVILNELNISWIRPKALKYDGRNYFADFYLPDYDIWLDPKNDYKAKQDEEKIRKVIEQNSVKLFVLLKQQITKEYIASLVK